MALPKKCNIRKITIDGIEYYWQISFIPLHKILCNSEDKLYCIVGLTEQPNYCFSKMENI
ncbi:hypothetical protein Fleli_2303 [Bernardetia litoralis DSM 6794]|uniref:Uncharacterized protein n=1 Tax=Bernardetia litoralis (strain ATCC 23117 / DSM 6794 / NBRC 15988 / NCIMB 1366 / Fx l1 / Sio-4) TaxID=880071 RepID=I4AL41_BERLS|nr:hypothetical protein Fleli_2303 [Bernardetia litoralis DSM 6794]